MASSSIFKSSVCVMFAKASRIDSSFASSSSKAYQGLAHYLEHMSLMGSKKYPQADSLAEYLKMHGGSHNASTAPYRTAFYLEVENDALPGAVDRLADAIAEPLLDKKYAERERNAVNAELTMARTRDGMRMAQVSAGTIMKSGK